jgi:hypothetical protein
MATITETKATCQACGHVWHYLPSDALRSTGEQLQRIGMDMTPCCCCLSGLTQRPKPIDQCPNCGSRAAQKERVTHTV